MYTSHIRKVVTFISIITLILMSTSIKVIKALPKRYTLNSITSEFLCYKITFLLVKTDLVKPKILLSFDVTTDTADRR